MIKGVNKQIVEINNTDNDYIEKAILIINPAMSEVSATKIKNEAKMYLTSITNQQNKSKQIKNTKYTITIIFLTILLFCTLTALVLVLTLP